MRDLATVILCFYSLARLSNNVSSERLSNIDSSERLMISNSNTRSLNGCETDLCPLSYLATLILVRDLAAATLWPYRLAILSNSNDRPIKAYLLMRW